MCTFEDFAPEIRAKAYGVSDPILRLYVRSAIIEMCERTRCWNRLIQEYAFNGDCRVTPADIDEDSEEIEAVMRGWCDHVPIKPLAASLAELSRFADMTFDGEYKAPPQKFFEVPGEPGVIGIWPAPDQQYNGRLVLQIALKPLPTTDDFDDVFLKRYRRTVIEGALAEILDLPGNAFYNAGSAAAKKKSFEGMLIKARIDVDRGLLVNGDLRVQMQTFGPYRRKM